MLNHGQIVRLIFGLKLRGLRQERRLSPAKLGRACDVSVSYLSESEQGKKRPKAGKILSLSQALGMRYDQLTSLKLPRHLGLQSLFFLGFDQPDAAGLFKLTRELHLSRPHGHELNEHNCRRWVSPRLLDEARALPVPDTAAAPVTAAGAHRSRYFGTDDENLCFTLARAGTLTQPAVSVTVGLRCDDHLRGQIRFLADPALPFRVVNEPSGSRAAAPAEIVRQAERVSFEAAATALVQGEY